MIYPSRPRFSWDMKNAPWTDGKGNQERFYEAVQQWVNFHNLLPDSNSNKIPANLQGVILQSQLYGRARDLCLKISSTEIQMLMELCRLPGLFTNPILFLG